VPLAAGEAATTARSGYLAGQAFAANRIEFVNLIVNHPTGLGVMEVALLQEFTFTDLTPRGPDRSFISVQVDVLLASPAAVRATAVAAGNVGGVNRARGRLLMAICFGDRQLLK
jgi:type I restriction enzyme R subunit